MQIEPPRPFNSIARFNSQVDLMPGSLRVREENWVGLKQLLGRMQAHDPNYLATLQVGSVSYQQLIDAVFQLNPSASIALYHVDSGCLLNIINAFSQGDFHYAVESEQTLESGLQLVYFIPVNNRQGWESVLSIYSASSSTEKCHIGLAKQQTAQLEMRFANAINALDVGIALYASDGELIKSNDYFDQYFSVLLVGKPLNEIGFTELIDNFMLSIASNNSEKVSNRKRWLKWYAGVGDPHLEFYFRHEWYYLKMQQQEDLTQVLVLCNVTDTKNKELLLEKKQQELKSLALRDALTHIYNRRKFNESLDVEFRRAKRDKKNLCLLMCDIDEFKKYNDFFGHLQGDECLVQVATAINQQFSRAADVVARYGGEEFSIILPNTELREAQDLAKMVLSAVNNLKIPHAANAGREYVSLSIGVALYTCFDSKENELELVDHADTALYSAKKAGRNCIRSFSRL